MVDHVLAALRASRKCIRRHRRDVFESHIDYTVGRPRRVTDPAALEWLAELDAVLKKIDRAIAEKD